MRIPIESSTSYWGRNSRPNWLILAAIVAAARAAGHWYEMLAKPEWAPPNSGFGPVWTVLYVSMGTSAWLLAPYLIWVKVAIALKLALWRVNP